ncbi:UNVERIFIED_CONTAM: hypothetical protein FKN15_052228 [Acipenser sinensis]
MRQQQELEELAHPQFMEVCTPSRLKATREMEESRNSWVQIGRSREKKKLCQKQPPEIQTSNSLLEKELEEMRQQQELEELTHPQFMEVCTPSRLKATREMEESRNSWVQIGRSREKKKLCQKQPPEIQTSNIFR